MDVLNSIIEKLNRYLISNMGFEETEEGLSKKLSSEDYCLSPNVVKNIMEGKAYKGSDPYETIQSILVENYIGEKIMDNAIYEIGLSQEEKDFIESEDESDDDDDFTYNGYSEIESWVSGQNIYVDQDELKKFVSASI